MNNSTLISTLQQLGNGLPAATIEQELAPIRVAVSGATGAIGSFLCQFIAQGRMFGPYQRVILQLVGSPHSGEEPMRGLAMELFDGAYSTLHSIDYTCDPMVGFNDIDAAILCASVPRLPGMERHDLLLGNAKLYQAHGAAIDAVAKKTVKVCVVGNPCNTNARVLSLYAPSIPKS